MGKAGLIGKKLVATFASTGTPSHFVHPGEAIHGDLGRFGAHDVVLALSNSGETEELIRIIPMINRQAACLMAMTGSPSSTLARAATHVLHMNMEVKLATSILPPHHQPPRCWPMETR